VYGKHKNPPHLQDGDLRYNNPVNVAQREADRVREKPPATADTAPPAGTGESTVSRPNESAPRLVRLVNSFMATMNGHMLGRS